MNSPAIIRQRRDSASAWTSANPILHSGQLGFELDTRKLKIGNGEDEWNDLPYVGTPLDATYLVKDSNGDLTAERVVGNSTSIVANWDTAGAVSFERAAFTGDVTASANDNTLTIANSAVTFSKFQNSATAGLSVIGRNVASAGVFAEINAATDGHVLRRNGSNLEFGAIATTNIADDAVTYAKIQNVTATSRLLGRVTAGAGNIEEISLGTGLIFSSGNLAFSAGAANQVLFNNSNASPTTVTGDAKFTFNPSTDTLTLGTAIGGVPKLASSNTSFNILPTTVTALTIGDLASIEFGMCITGARTYDFGNSAATHATLRVYGETRVTGAIRVGASNSGNIQDSTGNNKINFTSTTTTISGTDVAVSGNLTVTGNGIKSSSDTVLTLSADDVTVKGNITSNEGYKLGTNAVNAQTGTTYTLLDTDNGRIVTCDNGNAITVTVPSGLPANFTCTIVALGAGKVTLSQSSTTLNWYGGTGNVTIAGQYGAATLLRYGNNTFHVSGTLQ